MPRSATAIALSDLLLIKITKSDFEILIKKEKDIGLKIYKNIAKQICNILRENDTFFKQWFKEL